MSGYTGPQIDDFDRLLLEITQSIYSDELSQIKQVLRTSNSASIGDIDEIKYTGDLIRLLFDKKRITRSNLDLLISLLRLVKRHDLMNKVVNYCRGSRPVNDTNLGKLPPSSQIEPVRSESGYFLRSCGTNDQSYPNNIQQANPHSGQSQFNSTDHVTSLSNPPSYTSYVGVSPPCYVSGSGFGHSELPAGPPSYSSVDGGYNPANDQGGSQSSQMSIDDDADLGELIPLSGASATDEEKVKMLAQNQ